MEYSNKFNMTVDALSVNESFVRGAVAAFCLSLNPTLEEVGDVKTAVSEAVTNCIVHGYRGKGGVISIFAGINQKESKIDIIIEDFGVGISDVEQAMQTFFTTCDTGERSGMGFTVMEAFTDDLKVTSKVDNGTVVKMTKYFGKASAQE